MAGKPSKKSSKKPPTAKATGQPASTVTPISQPGKGGEIQERVPQSAEALATGNKITDQKADGHKIDGHKTDGHTMEGHSIERQRIADQIRVRAYELFEQRGRLEGYDREDWARAEQEILTKFQREKSA
jgi:hypothetical protein